MSGRTEGLPVENIVGSMGVSSEPAEVGSLSTPSRWPAALEPAQVAHSIRTRWNLIVAVALITTGLAWTLSSLQPRRYRAETVVAVVPAAGIDPDQVFRGVEVLQYRTVVGTLAALATTGSAATDAVGSGRGYDINAFVLPHADLLRIEVEGPDAQNAAAIANRLPPLLSAQAHSLYRFYAVTPVTRAVAPSDAEAPRTSRAILGGAVIGLLLGIAAAAVSGRMRAAA